MRLLGRLLDLVYPPACALCGAACRAAVCAACEGKLELAGERTCRRCGASLDGRVCRECRGREFRFARAVAVGRHEGTLRDLILRFKLSGRIHLARDLGRRIAQRVLDETVPVDAVTAVPMSRRTLLGRGYNPAEELAVCAAAALRRPFVPALRKVRATKPQATLPVAERSTNPIGAFAVRRAARVRGRTVLLVDDVLTTGATADECAKVLLEAGAREVNLAVVGR
ncbi:MAG: ComF family protein [Planctomycetota bacterium]